MKTVLPYRTTTSLGEWLRKEQARRMMQTKENVMIKEVEQDLANYCGLTIDGIRRIKRSLCSPSIEVAFKIAEFFDTTIGEVFELVHKESTEENKSNQVELIDL